MNCFSSKPVIIMQTPISSLLSFLLLFLTIAHLTTTFQFHSSTVDPKCTPEKMLVRREWYIISHTLTECAYWNFDNNLRRTLSEDDRRKYVNAVRCLQQLPAKVSRTAAPGVRSRYDDFVAIHIFAGTDIHFSVSFRPSFIAHT
jgi:hypothetical protein